MVTKKLLLLMTKLPDLADPVPDSIQEVKMAV